MRLRGSIKTKMALFTVLVFMLSMALYISPVQAAAGDLTVTMTAPDNQPSSGGENTYQVTNPVSFDAIYFCWNFSNGLDKNLDSNLQQISLKTKNGEPVVLSPDDFKYTKQDKPKLRQLELTLNSSALIAATDYIIEMTPGFTANNGEDSLGKIYSWEFTTSGPVEMKPAPVLKGIEVTTSKDISLTFDKEMKVPADVNGQLAVKLDHLNATVLSIEKAKQAGKIKITIEPKVNDATKLITVNYIKSDEPAKQLKSTDGGILESFIVQPGETGEPKVFKPIVDSQVEVGDSNKNLAVTNTTPATTITVPKDINDAAINVAGLLNIPSDGKVKTNALPDLSIATNTSISDTPVQVVIPAGTTIEAPAGWDGTINVPTVQANNSVIVTPDTGKTATVKTVIEVGFGDVPLTFINQAVKLVIPGQAGKDVGYYQNGSFTKITRVCDENTQAWADTNLPAGGDGRIDVDSDLVIWTKHFTNFVTYEQTVASGGGSGDSGGNNGGNGGDGTGEGKDSGTTGSLQILSFNKVKLSADDTLLQFDFSNGMDRVLENNMNHIRIYEKATNKEVKCSNYQFIKEGTKKTGDAIRRLELRFNNLSSGTTYVVELGTGVEANNGGTLGTKHSFEFTTTGTATGAGGIDQLIEQGIAKEGGTITEYGTSIEIPAAAFDQNIKVSVQIIADISKLPMAEKSKMVSDVMEITKDKAGNFNKPVTITITFDKSKVDTKKYDLSICYLNEKENKWIPLENVKVDWATGKVSGETKHFTKFAVIATEKVEVKEQVKKEEPVAVESGKVVKLSDIQGHWAEKTIAELVALGAIGGYPDGTFKPDQGISRAEFATIVVNAFQLPEKTGKVFEDTANHWAKNFIATAAAHGIVSGYSNTTFGPDDPITREQMAVMIVKAAKLAEAQGKTFADTDKVSAWAKNAVVTASGKSIISGYPDNTFRPQNNATRAEAATVIIKSLKLAS